MPRATFALRPGSTVQWLALTMLVMFDGVRCQPYSNCVWSLATELKNYNVLSYCGIALDETELKPLLNLSSVAYAREPINWLPQALRMRIPSSARSASVLLLGVTISIPSCAMLWKMVERECTFHVSSTWPSLYLETGPAFLYFRRLSGAKSSAERVNITCPLSDWNALLTSRVGANTTDDPPASVLAPCGTATVSTGQGLVEALQRLQLGHTRVLMTLAGDISLPTDPTPQRLEVSPDDTQPLIVIYRNVTLAGGTSLVYNITDGGSQGGVELDVRMRRNAFDLVTARRQPRADQQGGPPVLILTDIRLVDIPPGPLHTWPLGLLSTWYYYADMDRSGTGGLQIYLLRSMMVYTAGEHSYINFWYTRMMSLLREERLNGSWLQAIIDPLQMVRDDDGYAALFGNVLDFYAGYNSSITDAPLHTDASPSDFDLWSLEPQPASQLPPSSFTTARNATQLLALMQESWTRGPRVILLVANITLIPGEWPQGGASLSYNLTLAGPVAGAPVWLDTGSMALVGTAVAAGSSNVVTVRLLRLRLVGFSSPLMTAPRDDVAQAAAQGAFTGSQGLESWRDRCLELPASVGGALAAGGVRYEVRTCVLGLPQAHLALLQLYNAAADCNTHITGDNVTAVIAAACQLLQPQGYSADPTRIGGSLLTALLTDSLQAAEGSEVFINSSSTSPAIVLSHATLGGVMLFNTTAVSTTTAEALQGEAPACETGTLLLAVAASLAAGQLTSGANGPPRGSNHTPRKAALIGGLLGGVTAGVLAAVVAVLLVVRRWQPRWLLTHTDKPGGGVEVPSVAVVVSTAGSNDGAPAGGEVSEAADDGRVAREAYSITLNVVSSQHQTARDATAAMEDFRRRHMFSGGPAATGQPPRPPRRLPGDAGPQRRVDPAPSYLCVPLSVAYQLEQDIEKVREKCQELSQGGSQKKSKMRLLGSGGFASVFLSEWCGLSVAVKLLTYTQGDTDRARQRLATEAALTMSLDHPHIVPTYDVDVINLKVTDKLLVPPMSQAARAFLRPAAVPAAHPTVEDEDAPDYAAAIQVRLTMQYCEGGTLGAALATGKFAAPPDSASTSLKPEAGPTAVASAWLLRWEDLSPVGNMLLALLAARDVTSALKYLHGVKVVHGDLTENNVLLKAVTPRFPTSMQPRSKSLADTFNASVNVADAASNSPGDPPGVGACKSEAPPIAVSPAAPAVTNQTHPCHGVGNPTRGQGTGAQRPAGYAHKSLHHIAQQPLTLGRPVVKPASAIAGAAAAGGHEIGTARPFMQSDIEIEPVRQSSTVSSSSSNSDLGEGSMAALGAGLTTRHSAVPTTTMDSWALRSILGTTSTAPSEPDGRAGTGRSSMEAESDTSPLLATLAARLCTWSFKLSDFGLSVQLYEAGQTHVSNQCQGTPVFAAPEVLESGRLAPAADVYSFGVLLWLLLHGVSLKQIRPLLPRVLLFRPVAEDLLRHTSDRLPAAARELMRRCLSREPAQRPTATQLKSAVEGLLKDAAGHALYQLLVGVERREVLSGPP